MEPYDEELIEEAKEEIPSLKDIFSRGIRIIKKEGIDESYIKNNFGEAASRLESSAYSIYTEYEKKALLKLIDLWINKHELQINKDIKEIIENMRRKDRINQDFLEVIKKSIVRIIPTIKRFELVAGNMRKSRGGRTWELAIPYLLNKIKIKSEKPKGTDKKLFKEIDVIIPDVETAKKRPEKTIFLSAKRTLRERWKEVVDEERMGYVYLITNDDHLSESKAKNITEHRIILYVRDELKEKESLSSINGIRKLSDLPNDLKDYVEE